VGKKARNIIIGVGLIALSIYNPTVAKSSFTFFGKAFKVAKILKGVGAALILTSFGTKPKPPRFSIDYTTQERAATNARREIVLGRVRKSGYSAIPAWISGTSGQHAHRLLVLAGHRIAEIGDVFFDGNLIPTENIAAISSSDASGNVTAGTYANKANLRRYTGTDAEPWDWLLGTAISEWDNSHRLHGVAKLFARFTYDTVAYASGAPNISANLLGARAYDPRKDSTAGGSGAHRLANPETWEGTTNNALLSAWYLTSALGPGYATSEIDWTLVAAAATICDEDVTVPNGSGGSASQKRYTCNAVFEADGDFTTKLEALARSMHGTIYWRGGQWRIYAGAWTADTFVLDDSDVMEPYTLRSPTTQDRWNSVQGQYRDKARNYEPSDFQARRNSTYVTQDGGLSVPLDVELPCCTDEYEAQRWAIVQNRSSRFLKEVTLVCSGRAWGIVVWQVGRVTLSPIGWFNKLVRCVGWEDDPATGLVTVTLRETDSSIYNTPVLGDYTVPGTPNIPATGSTIPSAPTALTPTGLAGVIRFEVIQGAVSVPNQFFELLEAPTGSPVSSAIVVWSGNTLPISLDKNDTTSRDYWVRAGTPFSLTRSAAYPAGAGVAAAALAASSGSPGDSLYVQYSVNGSTGWHDPPFVTGDLFMRQRIGLSGAWGPAIRIVGEPGTNGSNGTDGGYVDYIFIRAASQPSTPTGATPAGWSDSPPAPNGNPLWMSTAEKTAAGALVGVWSTPIQIEGQPGPGTFEFRGRGVARVGNRLTKVSAGGGWDADGYSVEGFASAYASARAGQTNAQVMFALNRDPTTDSSYEGLDYAIYFDGSANVYAYESNTPTALGTYTTADTFSIVAHNGVVRYFKNGVRIRELTGQAAGPFYLDSSFVTGGASLADVRFGKLATTDDLAPGVATQIAAASAATQVGPVGSTTGAVSDTWSNTPSFTGWARTLVGLTLPAFADEVQVTVYFEGEFQNDSAFIDADPGTPSVIDPDANGLYTFLTQITSARCVRAAVKRAGETAGTPNFAVLAQTDFPIPVRSGVTFSDLTTGVGRIWHSVAGSTTFTVPPGQAVDVGCGLRGSEGASTYTFLYAREVKMRVEVIKR
jgi:hypothetical protein